MSYSNVQRVRILYKTILKLHKGLPPELQVVGTNYARDEFKRHKKCNPTEADIFVAEWTNYALSLAKQLGLKGPISASKKFGEPLSQCELQHFRDEQIVQLYELMVEATSPKEKVEN